MAVFDLPFPEVYYPPPPPSSPAEESSSLSFPVASPSPASFAPTCSDTKSQTIDIDEAAMSSSSLTPLERSRQARNKDIDDKPSKPSPSKGKKKTTNEATDKSGDAKEPKTGNELFEEQERMYTAARVLDSTELLIFHAHANNEVSCHSRACRRMWTNVVVCW